MLNTVVITSEATLSRLLKNAVPGADIRQRI
jgi:hypothetical protein